MYHVNQDWQNAMNEMSTIIRKSYGSSKTKKG
jgi:hypothetical protein